MTVDGHGRLAERAAGKLDEEGQQPGPGRGLQQAVGGRDRRRGRGDQGRAGSESRIAGTLGFLRAAGMRRQETDYLAQQRKRGGRRTGFCGKAPFRICAGRGRLRPRTPYRLPSSPRGRWASDAPKTVSMASRKMAAATL